MALAYLFQGGRGAVIGKGAFIRINTVFSGFVFIDTTERVLYISCDSLDLYAACCALSLWFMRTQVPIFCKRRL